MRFLFLLLFISCQELGTPENQMFEELPDLASDAVVTFAQLDSLVLQPFGCVGCHSDWATSEAGVLTRITPGDPSVSPLFLRTQDGTMPQGGSGVGQDRLDLIELYILNFAP